MKKGNLYIIFLIISISFLTNLNAQIDAASTAALSDKLNKLGMFDLSFYLLEKEIKRNPIDKNKYLIQKAKTHLDNKEEEKGMAILKAVPTTSKDYPLSRLVLGMHYVSKQLNKEATIPLEAYCTSVKRNPPKPEERFRVEEFQTAVAFLQHAYKQIGDTTKAVKVTEYLKILLPPKKKMTKIDVFQDLVFATQVRLDIAEQNKAEGKEGWEKDVNDALVPMTKILSDSGDLTVFSILAANEKLKALVLLEKTEEADNLVSEWKDLTRSLDPEFQKVDLLHEAPSAKMYLWIAELNLIKGTKETEDKAKRIKHNSNAIKDFYRVFTSYDSKLCPYIPAAAKGFNKAKMALQKDGKEVTAEVQPPINFNLERANTLYDKANDLFIAATKLTGEEQAKKQEEAKEAFNKTVPVLLKILREDAGKASENTADILSKLTDCYIKQGKTLEAISVAGFMGDCFPDSPNTPLFLLQLGEIKWKEFKKSPNTPEGEKAKKAALIVYEWYTRNCPTHKYASDIAAKVAMEYYSKAAGMAQKANAMPEGPGEIGEAKLKANIAAREEFKTVIPIFEYIVNNYSHTKRGKEAAFIMGNCYSNSYQYLKGVEVFSKYCELETNHPKKNERDMGRVADAKFRMGDNLVKYAESLRKETDPLKEKLETAPETVPEGSEEQSKADIQKEIDEKNAKAMEYFNLAIKNFREFTEIWIRPKGRLHGLTGADKEKVNTMVSHTIAYIPWVYDRAGDQDQTILAFTEFLKKYPDHKSAPNALKRRAFIYIDKGDTLKAAKDFDTLSTKFPDQAKTIQYELAKAMYEIKNYDKSIEAITKLFESNSADLTVSQLRWIARNLIDCGGKHPKEGALLSLKASGLLLVRLKEPFLEDWVNKSKIAELEADKEKLERALKVIKDQTLLVASDAAYFSEDYNQAIKYLDGILSDDKSPYFYSAHFKRAEVYRKLKEYSKALKDYGEISNVLIANPDAKESVTFKAQVLVGMTYIQMGDLGKATAAMAGATMSAVSRNEDIVGLKKKEVTKEEKEEQNKYAEIAVFLTACCENKLGNKDKAESLVTIYRKAFPNGKFKSVISMLPPPEQALEKVTIKIF